MHELMQENGCEGVDGGAGQGKTCWWTGPVVYALGFLMLGQMGGRGQIPVEGLDFTDVCGIGLSCFFRVGYSTPRLLALGKSGTSSES